MALAHTQRARAIPAEAVSAHTRRSRVRGRGSPPKGLALTSDIRRVRASGGGGGSTRSLKGLALTPDVVGPRGGRGIDSAPAEGLGAHTRRARAILAEEVNAHTRRSRVEGEDFRQRG